MHLAVFICSHFCETESVSISVSDTPPFSYNGGDCCEATCENTPNDRCGIINVGEIENARVGFLFCEDPNIMRPCSNDLCWAKSSHLVKLLSVENIALTTLSANGRILVVAEPALDAIRIFDRTDSRWEQMGSILEGPRGSSFGKVLVMDTPLRVVRCPVAAGGERHRYLLTVAGFVQSEGRRHQSTWRSVDSVGRPDGQRRSALLDHTPGKRR